MLPVDLGENCIEEVGIYVVPRVVRRGHSKEFDGDADAGDQEMVEGESRDIGRKI